MSAEDEVHFRLGKAEKDIELLRERYHDMTQPLTVASLASAKIDKLEVKIDGIQKDLVCIYKELSESKVKIGVLIGAVSIATSAIMTGVMRMLMK